MRPRPQPPKPASRSGLRHSITHDVRDVLARIPDDASVAIAQNALYPAGIAMPYPVVESWLDEIRNEGEPHDQ